MLRRFLLCLTLTVCCAVPAAATAGVDNSRPRELQTSSCTVVRVSDQAYALYRRGVPCTWAKRWARRLAASGGRKRPSGYSCTSGSKFRSGGWCERGGKHFGWDPGA